MLNCVILNVLLNRPSGIRSNIINFHFENNAAPRERSYTSALSSGIAGGGVTRLMGM
jgi:hypothetical protein